MPSNELEQPPKDLSAGLGELYDVTVDVEEVDVDMDVGISVDVDVVDLDNVPITSPPPSEAPEKSTRRRSSTGGKTVVEVEEGSRKSSVSMHIKISQMHTICEHVLYLVIIPHILVSSKYRINTHTHY